MTVTVENLAGYARVLVNGKIALNHATSRDAEAYASSILAGNVRRFQSENLELARLERAARNERRERMAPWKRSAGR